MIEKPRDHNGEAAPRRSVNPYAAPGAEIGLAASSRSNSWRWFVCVLLLLGTVVNYMDRLTVNLLAKPIQAEFSLNNEQYGNLELGFGLAFAAGSLLFGWMVDRLGVYWLYPVVLVGWSLMGFLTGYSRSYQDLLILRIFLGIFEAGNFPCGLKTVQLLMAPRDRALGNGLLQSGTALGAVLAPQAIRLIQSSESDWRRPFLIIGAAGTAWVVLWLVSMRPSDLRVTPPLNPDDRKSAEQIEPPLWRILLSARFLALMFMVICINMNWHLFRVWLPKFLQEARGYDQKEMFNFTTLYYVAADIGSLAAGLMTGWLARRGLTVYGSRMWVFAGCCALTSLTTAAALLPAGPLLLASLLLVAFGGLGSFAAYYSLTQDLSRKHQGFISGALATITWLVVANSHPIFGRYIDRFNYYDLGIGVVGWLPAVSLVAVLLLWNLGKPRSFGADEGGEVAGVGRH